MDFTDDILILCNPEDEQPVTEYTSSLIKEYELEIQEEKRSVIHFRDDHNGNLRGFEQRAGDKYKDLQYLGFMFNGRNIYLRPSTYSRHLKKLRKAVTRTVSKAFRDKSSDEFIRAKKLYSRYVEKKKGYKSNFPSYAFRAANESEKSKIRQQIKNNPKIMKRTIAEKSEMISKKMKE